jgi:hypothetical protein
MEICRPQDGEETEVYGEASWKAFARMQGTIGIDDNDDDKRETPTTFKSGTIYNIHFRIHISKIPFYTTKLD